jgi:hypothetical protein
LDQENPVWDPYKNKGSIVTSHRKSHHITLLTFFFSSLIRRITYKFVSYHIMTFFFSRNKKIDRITYKFIKKISPLFICDIIEKKLIVSHINFIRP